MEINKSYIRRVEPIHKIINLPKQVLTYEKPLKKKNNKTIFIGTKVNLLV